MELELQGQYTRSVYFKAIQWIYRPSTKMLIIRTIAFIAFAILYIFYIEAATQDSLSANEFSRIARHAITFLILAFFLFGPLFKGFLAARRLWADPITRRELRGRVSSMGIQFYPSIDWMKWESIIKVNQQPDFVVLLTGTWEFAIVPRNFFRSEGEWKTFLAMVASKVVQVIE